MLSFTLRTTGLGQTIAWQNVMPRFTSEAGTLVLDAVRDVLGTDALYILDPEYAKAKPRRKGYRRMPGKPIDQPLILSGEGIFLALTARQEGNSVVVQVDPNAGVTPQGFDYAEEWEEKVHYLERGLEAVEEQLDEVLARIIVEEMGL